MWCPCWFKRDLGKLDQRDLQNVKTHECEFKHLKEATVNWLPYFMFQACFMTSNMFQFCWNDCIVRAEVNVKEQLSLLSEFTPSWRRDNSLSGVVSWTRTVLRIFLGLQIIHSLCFSWRIILFWRPRRGSLILAGLTSHLTKNIPRWRLTFTSSTSGECFHVLIQRQSFIYFVSELRCIKTKQHHLSNKV